MIAFILLLCVLALMFGMYVSKRTESRRRERSERFKEKQNELIESLRNMSDEND